MGTAQFGSDLAATHLLRPWAARGHRDAASGRQVFGRVNANVDRADAVSPHHQLFSPVFGSCVGPMVDALSCSTGHMPPQRHPAVAVWWPDEGVTHVTLGAWLTQWLWRLRSCCGPFPGQGKRSPDKDGSRGWRIARDEGSNLTQVLARLSSPDDLRWHLRARVRP
jgi:hypothetical protein